MQFVVVFNIEPRFLCDICALKNRVFLSKPVRLVAGSRDCSTGISYYFLLLLSSSRRYIVLILRNSIFFRNCRNRPNAIQMQRFVFIFPTARRCLFRERNYTGSRSEYKKAPLFFIIMFTYCAQTMIKKNGKFRFLLLVYCY